MEATAPSATPTTSTPEEAPYLQLGHNRFTNRESATKYFRDLLNNAKLGRVIRPKPTNHSYFAALHDLISQGHKNAAEKIGTGITAFTILPHAEFTKTRCFYIVRQDNSRTDFSYRKCLYNLFKATGLPEAPQTHVLPTAKIAQQSILLKFAFAKGYKIADLPPIVDKKEPPTSLTGEGNEEIPITNMDTKDDEERPGQESNRNGEAPPPLIKEEAEKMQEEEEEDTKEDAKLPLRKQEQLIEVSHAVLREVFKPYGNLRYVDMYGIAGTTKSETNGVLRFENTGQYALQNIVYALDNINSAHRAQVQIEYLAEFSPEEVLRYTRPRTRVGASGKGRRKRGRARSTARGDKVGQGEKSVWHETIWEIDSVGRIVKARAGTVEKIPTVKRTGNWNIRNPPKD